MSTQTTYVSTPKPSEQWRTALCREGEGGLVNKVSGKNGDKANQAKVLCKVRTWYEQSTGWDLLVWNGWVNEMAGRDEMNQTMVHTNQAKSSLDVRWGLDASKALSETCQCGMGEWMRWDGGGTLMKQTMVKQPPVSKRSGSDYQPSTNWTDSQWLH